jgi:hypothetical protein
VAKQATGNLDSEDSDAVEEAASAVCCCNSCRKSRRRSSRKWDGLSMLTPRSSWIWWRGEETRQEERVRGGQEEGGVGCRMGREVMTSLRVNKHTVGVATHRPRDDSHRNNGLLERRRVVGVRMRHTDYRE